MKSIINIEIVLIISALIGFLVTNFTTKRLIKYLKENKLVVKDQNKKNKPFIPISGGLSVFAGFLTGTISFIILRTIFSNQIIKNILKTDEITLISAGLISIFLTTVIGFLDDKKINKNKNKSKGLKQWQKPVLTLIASIPIMLVMLEIKNLTLPFFGEITFGSIYPFLLVPIGFIGATNMINLLAGFNGLETGLGIIYMTSLGLYSYIHENYLASFIALMVILPLCSFWFYNKCPAKILPGDSLTYFLGGSLATIAILGRIEFVTLIISMPFIIEFILKLRSKLQADSFGFYKNGKICSKYKKIYSIPHIFTRKCKYTEKQVVYLTLLIELFFAILIWII